MGDILFNLRFIFSPGSCGWFCLRFILKRKMKKNSYFNLLEMKKVLSENNYYCVCVKVDELNDVFGECLTLIKNKEGLHYVVLKKTKNGYVFFYDPLFIGIRKKKVSWFVSRWSNFCLIYTKV